MLVALETITIGGALNGNARGRGDRRRQGAEDLRRKGVGPGGGAAGGDDSGGASGGAIQLVAGTSITIEATGSVHVGAGGGSFGGVSSQEAAAAAAADRSCSRRCR